MTPVEFYAELPDKTEHLLRLVRKASRQGARLWVLCDDPQALSQALWRMSSAEFVAHATTDSDEATQTASAVLLCTSDLMPGRDSTHDVLINARHDWPQRYQSFARVMELVGLSQEDVVAGRERWKAYLADGVTPRKLG